MARSGPETWEIDGRKYSIASTYYLGLPDGLQFTIDYEVRPDFVFDGITQEVALRTALPLMHYAASHRLHARAAIRDKNGTPASIDKIGVSLFSKSGIHTRGYRVAKLLTELQAPTTNDASVPAAAPPN